MRNFFIDLENVRSYGLEGVLLLNTDDRVYVFYSDNANTLTIPTIESLSASPASIKYIKTNYIGANAMDFQIVTLLGASIEQLKTGSFYIISHDNGFKSAVKFCEGYFTEYDIITGVYANIVSALNSENSREDNKKAEQNASAANSKNKRRKSKKQADKNTTDVSAEKVPDNTADKSEKPADTGAAANAKTDNNVNTADNSASENSEAVQPDNEKPAAAKKRNSSRNRRNRQKKQEGSADNSANTDSGASAVKEEQPANETSAAGEKTEPAVIERVSAEKGFQADESLKQEQSSEGRKKQKKKNPKGKGKQEKAGNNDGRDITAAVPVSEEPKSMKYVYNALSDYLSKSTIDMYAKKIDEGIRYSSNRNELHDFFKKSYGSDEAEALFKIVSSDFEDMKKHVN